MSACRYERGPCTYPTLRRYFRCQDGSCPEQVGRMCSRPAGPADETKPPIRETAEPFHETKPAAPPPAREEEKTMAQGKAGTSLPVGACDRCGNEKKLGMSKHAPGKRLCVCCSVRAYKLSKQGLPLDQAGGKKKASASPGAATVATASPAKAAKAPGAPKEPRPAPIAQQPASTVTAKPSRHEPPVTRHLEPVPEPSNSGLRLVFEVRIRPGMTPLEIMDLMRAVPSDAVVAG